MPSPSFETLDAIADSVNPVLGLVALTWPWLQWRGQWRLAALHVLVTLLSVAFAYAITALDRANGWWQSWGLDFSTHAAVCVALIVALCSINLSLAGWWVGVFGVYVALMLYQEYHGVADIVTTAAAIAPVVIGLRMIISDTHRLIRRYATSQCRTTLACKQSFSRMQVANSTSVRLEDRDLYVTM